MSSGEFASVRIDEIVINPSGRIRREWDDSKLDELAESIGRLGLIHPPVISREMVLSAGWSRIQACSRLGWDRITIQWADSLDERKLLAMEIEENIKRYALTWQDEVDGIKKFHDLRKEEEPSWSLDDTARELGYSKGAISEKIGVAVAIASGNVRVTDAKVYSTAKGIVKRETIRARADEAAVLAAVEDIAPSSPILTKDFNEWATTYSGVPFNLINCDFPYGINADTFNQGAAASFGGYKDTFATYEKLCDTLHNNLQKLCGESAHIIFWYSMKHHEWTKNRLESMGLTVNPYPLVWLKSDNKGTLPDPNRGPRQIYEVAFFCSLGDRPIITPVSNAFAAATVRTGEHMSEKSEDMLAYFFRMVVDENTRLLDPTCGSGSALRAARRLGCVNALGLEMNEEYAELARRAWNA